MPAAECDRQSAVPGSVKHAGQLSGGAVVCAE